MTRLSDLMGANPNTIYKKQHAEFKKHVEGILAVALQDVQRGLYDLPHVETFESPAGDGMGMDNVCINFHYDLESPKNTMDIFEAMQLLKDLRDKGEVEE